MGDGVGRGREAGRRVVCLRHSTCSEEGLRFPWTSAPGLFLLTSIGESPKTSPWSRPLPCLCMHALPAVPPFGPTPPAPQFSVGIGVPLTVLLLRGMPMEATTGATGAYAALLLIMGGSGAAAGAGGQLSGPQLGVGGWGRGQAGPSRWGAAAAGRAGRVDQIIASVAAGLPRCARLPRFCPRALAASVFHAATRPSVMARPAPFLNPPPLCQAC